jgi:tetratricopeptide (TPR) repeat protein
MIRLLLLTFVLVTIISCNRQYKQTVNNPKAIELNNKAVELMKVQKYDSALILLDQAISLDLNYLIAYGSKAAIYIELKDYKKALIETENQIKIKPDYAEAMSVAGFICDKTGDSIKAMDYYKKSLEIYNDRIANFKDSVQLTNNKINKACLLIITGQESKGKDELKKLKEVNLNDTKIDEFLKMDRQSYLQMIKEK